MELSRGRYLFHYTTREAAFDHIVPEGKLRFSRYAQMRDPLENKIWRLGVKKPSKKSQEDWRQNSDNYLAFDRFARRIRERSFLLSMTTDANPRATGENDLLSRGWVRARMWEQYAENHAGACLVFDREQLVDRVDESLDDQGFTSAQHRAVEYDSSEMFRPILEPKGLSGEVTPEDVAAYVRENARALFFHKTLDWATEHEYRFTTTTSNDRGDLYVDYGRALVGVIVSENFPDWQVAGVEALCEAKEISARRLDWSFGAPLLYPLGPRLRLDADSADPGDAAPPSADPAGPSS